MQNWFPIGSRLQVVTTVPKCDAVRPTKSFAPLVWLKILFTSEPEKRNNLKIFYFLKSIFILYILNVVKKGIFPFVSKQESTINAGESFFRYVSCNIYLYFEISVFYLYKEIASMFNVMNTRLHKCFLMS